MPRVSVIIPTYNFGEFLGECILSVLSQTYPVAEIIVVDDGSTDNTESVASAFLSRIIYIKKPNGGPASARNAGLNRATGEYITFLDADDQWTPEKIADQVEFFENNKMLGFIYSKICHYDNISGAILSTQPPIMYSGWIFDKILCDNFIALPTIMVRGSVLNKVGYFNEQLITAEDYNLYLRIAKSFQVGALDKIHVMRRIHSRNISFQASIPASTLHNLEHIIHLFPEYDYKRYKPMKLAFIRRGKAMIVDDFTNSNYNQCRNICRYLLSKGIYHNAFIFYWLCSFLPPTFIKYVRRLKRSIVYGSNMS